MIQIRSMTDDDLDEVLRIYRQGIETGIASFHTECPTKEEWVRSRLLSCRLVAVDQEKIVGWAALMSYSAMYAYRGVAEVSVYVDLDHGGQGIGCALLDALSEASEQEGFWTLESKIIKENEASIRLHEKCGYRIVGRHERIAQDKAGVWRDIIIMERRSPVIR